MLPDRVLNPGPLTYESCALPIVLRGPVATVASPSSDPKKRISNIVLISVWYEIRISFVFNLW